METVNDYEKAIEIIRTRYKMDDLHSIDATKKFNINM